MCTLSRKVATDVTSDDPELNPPHTLGNPNPMTRDTIIVPAGGAVNIAFRADNPGAWILCVARRPIPNSRVPIQERALTPIGCLFATATVTVSNFARSARQQPSTRLTSISFVMYSSMAHAKWSK